MDRGGLRPVFALRAVSHTRSGHTVAGFSDPRVTAVFVLVLVLAGSLLVFLPAPGRVQADRKWRTPVCKYFNTR